MQVTVKFFALAVDLAGTRELTLDLPAHTTVGQLWEQVLNDHPGLARYRDEFLLAVNRRFASPEQTLEQGDVVAVIPPVSGGSSPAGDNYDLTTTPLDLAPAIAAVRHPEAGAIVTFTGTVRELTGDTRTFSVDYEAYPEMAVEQLRAIGEEIRARWQVTRIWIVHRYGHLLPGEDSVIIAVSSPHRAEAFAACRHAIDRIKEMVPVWKRETTQAGSSWARG
ncbi:MAG TPA: molybdopterin converting factor subunit 1 [Firmicutes bacterium]|nr:molybdopterin converting factor subunit 1 [Bacillota bacterium]